MPLILLVPAWPWWDQRACGLTHWWCRHEGLLVVKIIEARDLQKADLSGKADPLVTVWTQHMHKQSTVRPAPSPAALYWGLHACICPTLHVHLKEGCESSKRAVSYLVLAPPYSRLPGCFVACTKLLVLAGSCNQGQACGHVAACMRTAGTGAAVKGDWQAQGLPSRPPYSSTSLAQSRERDSWTRAGLWGTDPRLCACAAPQAEHAGAQVGRDQVLLGPGAHHAEPARAGGRLRCHQPPGACFSSFPVASQKHWPACAARVRC